MGCIKKLGLGARMILQVHDELLLEAAKEEWQQAAKIAKREMEGVAELRIPLKVELKVGAELGRDERRGMNISLNSPAPSRVYSS